MNSGYSHIRRVGAVPNYHPPAAPWSWSKYRRGSGRKEQNGSNAQCIGAVQSLANILAELRRAVGVTQFQAVDARATTQGQVNRIERQSNMLLSTFRAHLCALGVEVRLIVSENDVSEIDRQAAMSTSSQRDHRWEPPPRCSGLHSHLSDGGGSRPVRKLPCPHLAHNLGNTADSCSDPRDLLFQFYAPSGASAG